MTPFQKTPNVRLIGPARIETGSLVTAGFRSNRVSALLAYLCFRAGGDPLREEIADALWPQLAPEAARNNLRVTLRYLKQALEAHGLDAALRTDDRTRLSLDGGILLSDVALFWSLERRGRDREAAEIAGVALLPGLSDEWLDPYRAAFNAARGAVLSRLAEASLTTDPTCALDLARRSLADDPLDTRARRLVAQACLRLGDPAAAVRELSAYRALLRSELDEALPCDLAGILAEAERVTTPAATARPLPLERTRFYGRETELAAIASWTGGDDRLLTVYGPGGIGKSRLGMEAARRLAPSRAVFWVEASGAATRGALLDRVAVALGCGGNFPGSALNHVVAVLHDRAALIVLDNLESCPDEELPVVDELLGLLPGLQALGLSRKTLGLPGERTLRLDPLPLPESSEDVASPALAMLVDRIGGASVDDDLVRLARALEGIPLAIELAAAKTSTLSVRELLEGMPSRLDVLVGRSAKHARHRAMRATLDWSFDLLEPTLRDAVLDLAVLRNGWTVRAAAALGAGDLSHACEIVEVGCTNSLLVRDGVAGESRYRMLECTRDYALETLAPSRKARLRERHAAHYRERVRSGPSLEILERDEPNLEATLVYLAESPARIEELLEFGEGLARYWVETSAGRTALRTLEKVDGTEPAHRARLGLLRLRILRSISEFDRGVEAARAGLAEAEGGPTRVALLALLGRARRVQGRLEESAALGYEAVALAQGLPAKSRTEALLTLAQTKSIYDLDPATLDMVEEAVALAEASGDPYLLDEALDSLRLVRIWRGEFDEATRAADRQEALPLLSTASRQAATHLRRSQIAISRGDLPEGRARLEDALDLSRAAAHPWWLGQSLAQLGDTYVKLGLYAMGRDAHRESHDLRLRTGERRGLASCLRGMGMACYGLGEYEEAVEHLGRAKAMAEEGGEEVFLTTVLIPYARAALAAGRREGCVEALRAALEACDRLAPRAGLAREADLEGTRLTAGTLLAELDH